MPRETRQRLVAVLCSLAAIGAACSSTSLGAAVPPANPIDPNVAVDATPSATAGPTLTPLPTLPPPTPTTTATPTVTATSTPTPTPTPVPLADLLGPLTVAGAIGWPEDARDETPEVQRSLNLGASFLNVLLARLGGDTETGTPITWMAEDVLGVLRNAESTASRTVVTEGRAADHRILTASAIQSSPARIDVLMCVHLVTTVTSTDGASQNQQVTTEVSYRVLKNGDGEWIFSLFSTRPISQIELVDCPAPTNDSPS